MIQRSEVEWLLEQCIANENYMLCSMDLGRREVIELCRTWIAVQDAPVGRVPIYALPQKTSTIMAVLDDEIDAYKWNGQRVRLVADTGPSDE